MCTTQSSGASARLDDGQKATERTRPDKYRASSFLLRFLYWIYERRLLDQIKQQPCRVTLASSWMGIAAMLANEA